MDHRDEQALLKIRNQFDPAASPIYVIDDWYLLTHTWQSVSEQTLPTADNSVPLLQPQKRHASELLVVGLPKSTKVNKKENCCNETEVTDVLTAITENNQRNQQLLHRQTILLTIKSTALKQVKTPTYLFTYLWQMLMLKGKNNQDKEQVLTAVFYLSVL